MVKKIIIIFVILLTLFSIYSNATYAVGDIVSSADDFISKGKNANGIDAIDESKLKQTSDILYNVLLIIGLVIAVIWSAILGITFMTGSVSEKAKVKESLIPFIVGCIVVFGAFGIWKVAVNMLNGVESKNTQKVTYQSTIGNLQDLKKSNKSVSSLTDNEVKTLYDGFNKIAGPFSAEDQKLINDLVKEYNKRFKK